MSQLGEDEIVPPEDPQEVIDDDIADGGDAELDIEVMDGEEEDFSGSDDIEPTQLVDDNVPKGAKVAKKKRQTMSQRAGIILPASRMEKNLKSHLRMRVSPTASIYLAAVCEYLVAELIFVSTEILHAMNGKNESRKHMRLSPAVVMKALETDSDFHKITRSVDSAEMIDVEVINRDELKKIYNEDKLKLLRERRKRLAKRQKPKAMKETTTGDSTVAGDSADEGIANEPKTPVKRGRSATPKRSTEKRVEKTVEKKSGAKRTKKEQQTIETTEDGTGGEMEPILEDMPATDRKQSGGKSSAAKKKAATAPKKTQKASAGKKSAVKEVEVAKGTRKSTQKRKGDSD